MTMLAAAFGFALLFGLLAGILLWGRGGDRVVEQVECLYFCNGVEKSKECKKDETTSCLQGMIDACKGKDEPTPNA